MVTLFPSWEGFCASRGLPVWALHSFAEPLGSFESWHLLCFQLTLPKKVADLRPSATLGGSPSSPQMTRRPVPCVCVTSDRFISLKTAFHISFRVKPEQGKIYTMENIIIWAFFFFFKGEGLFILARGFTRVSLLWQGGCGRADQWAS